MTAASNMAPITRTPCEETSCVPCFFFWGQSVYMKSLILRSSRAFLGGWGFLGLCAIPGDICRHMYFQNLNFFNSRVMNVCIVYLRMRALPVHREMLRWLGNLASPWASWELRPYMETDKSERKRQWDITSPPSEGSEGHLKGVIVHHCPVMSRQVKEHYWTGLVVLPCWSWGKSP